MAKKEAAAGFAVTRKNPSDKIIALAGNPNVGKSTVFNALTGMNQHTGNWPGKTVANAQGIHHFHDTDYILVDLPGTYSLMAHSSEEEIARDFILFGGADAVIVVCDATCLERNLNLILQVIEITPNVAVCVNLMDEAEKKHIIVDLEALENELGTPVIGTSARSGKGLNEIMKKVEALCAGIIKPCPRKIRYQKVIEEAAALLIPVLEQRVYGKLDTRWLSLRLLEQDSALAAGIEHYMGFAIKDDELIQSYIKTAWEMLESGGVEREQLTDWLVSCIVLAAEEIAMNNGTCGGCSACKLCSACTACGRCLVHSNDIGPMANIHDRKLDKIFISKRFGIPIMLAMLCGVFWLTITGANYPSQILAGGLFWVQERLTGFFLWIGTPEWVHGALVLGVYRVLAWVVSVMLPPMAIFFPLFTLFEDFGYLPRIAFNLDHQFKRAKACGKQALTMCMEYIKLLLNKNLIWINLVSYYSIIINE